MDNKNDIERNRQLRRIGDALEKIAKAMEKRSVKNIEFNANGITAHYDTEDGKEMNDERHQPVMHVRD